MHGLVVEDGELPVRLHRDDPPLHDAALAEDPAVGHLGHPALEHGLLVAQGRPQVARREAHRGPDRAHNRIGRREDDVERRRKHGAVHAARSALVGHVEHGAPDGLGWLEVEHHGQRQRVERAHHDVERHGAPERAVLVRWRPVLVRPDEARQRSLGHVRLELVRQGGQLRGQPCGFGGRRGRTDRQPDQAAQDVGQCTRLGLAGPQGGVVLEGCRPRTRAQHGRNSTAGLPRHDIP